MKNYTLIFSLGILALSSCQSADTKYQGPTGATVHEAKCSMSPTGCFKKAAATCKGTYQVVDSSSNAGGLIADIMPGPVTWYKMTYQCGPTDGRMPAFLFRGREYTPQPIMISKPTTTTCTGVWNGVTCTSY